MHSCTHSAMIRTIRTFELDHRLTPANRHPSRKQRNNVSNLQPPNGSRNRPRTRSLDLVVVLGFHCLSTVRIAGALKFSSSSSRPHRIPASTFQLFNSRIEKSRTRTTTRTIGDELMAGPRSFEVFLRRAQFLATSPRRRFGRSLERRAEYRTVQYGPEIVPADEPNRWFG